MKLLFLSGAPTGGSAISTRQLAHRLAARGHEVGLLVQRRTRPRTGLVAPPRDRRIDWITAAPGRVCRALRRAATTQPRGAGTSEGVEEWTSVAPEQVLPSLCAAWGPGVVIVSSVHRRAWTAIHASLTRARIPVVFYVREAATFEHVPIAGLRPDLTVTNSEAHRRRAEELGVQACTIPSLIEFDACDEQTTREVALFVNPLPSRGLAVAVALARERPDVRFAFQLSWPLRRRDHRALRRWIRGQPNIELRALELQSTRVYRDARVLVLPYQVDNRPRVVLEAQWNGIPVLATDLPAHREAVGSGGLFVGADASPAEWATAFGALWDDRSNYERVCASARAHARRDDQDPARIAARFESLMERVPRGSACRVSLQRVPASVLLVGLDAADPGLVCGLAGEGHLPNIASLLREHVGVRVMNPDGVYVGAVWPTLFTGTSPGQHGRTWPGRFEPGTYQVRPFEPSDLGAEPFWNALDRVGRRVAVVDAPHTRADPDLGVTQVVEWGAHDAGVGFQTSPSSLAGDLVARFGRHPVDGCDRYSAEGKLEQLAHGLLRGVDRKAEFTRFLLDQSDWDAFVVVFGESHCVGHQCWHLHDSDHPRHDAAVAGVMADPVLDVYERLDAALGHLLAGVARDAEVFVLLSHGMGPHYDGSSLFTDVLRRVELAWDRQPSTWATSRDRLTHAWNRVARRLRLRPRETWVLDGSRAFFRAPNASLCSAIRVNVVGREPAGVVAPGEEYEELGSALEAELLGLVNVETGTRAVRRVLRPAEQFNGPKVPQMPDLLVEWHQESPIRSLASPTIGRVEGEYQGHRTGDHRRDGLLLRRGPTAARHTVDVVDACDLAPAMCALLDVPLPAASGPRASSRCRSM